MWGSVMLRTVVGMTSGGARARSGPAADPNALRRDRKDDKAWIDLPGEGFSGEIPDFPLPKALHFALVFEGAAKTKVPDHAATEQAWDAEQEFWDKLWRKPQAAMWLQLGLEYEVAAYVRAFLESVEAEASAGLKTAVLRMSAELGLSTVGMGQLRWRIAADEVSAQRDEVKTSRQSSRDRLKALNA